MKILGKDKSVFSSNFASDVNKPSEIYRTYDWIADNVYENLGVWVERAATDAGRYLCVMSQFYIRQDLTNLVIMKPKVMSVGIP